MTVLLDDAHQNEREVRTFEITHKICARRSPPVPDVSRNACRLSTPSINRWTLSTVHSAMINCVIMAVHIRNKSSPAHTSDGYSGGDGSVMSIVSIVMSIVMSTVMGAVPILGTVLIELSASPKAN
jgi:hypothetical protein